jgi:hypothetical protein
MGNKSHKPSFDVHDDMGTDYALVLTGVIAALIALLYLLLI